jgi:hypothetical protein
MWLNFYTKPVGCGHAMTLFSVDLAELAAGCLHLFILHRLEVICLVPQLIMPVYNFFYMHVFFVA